VISIIIMDDILIPEEVDYYHEYGILNKRTGTVFSDLLTIAVLELPKLPEEPDGREIWRWGRFFRSRNEEELKMAAEADAGVGQAAAVLMELSEDERTRLLAESREKFLWDQWGREKHQYSMGLEEGIERGRRETAKRLKAMGLPVDQIAAATGLDPEAIEAL
jgi:predicted transposase/invertase (TIGR01784 family)